MGLFGSPDLYPYDQIEKKCNVCGKKGTGKFCSECGTPYKLQDKYISIASIVVFTAAIVVFILCFIAAGVNLAGFFLSLILASCVSFLGNLICTVLCIFKKRKNKIYLIYTLFSISIAMFTFLLYGLICVK